MDRWMNGLWIDVWMDRWMVRCMAFVENTINSFSLPAPNNGSCREENNFLHSTRVDEWIDGWMD
jgi:hypothetical protein